MTDAEMIFMQFDTQTRLALINALQDSIAYSPSDAHADESQAVLLAFDYPASALAARQIRNSRTAAL